MSKKPWLLAEQRKAFESERTQVAEAYQQRLQQIQGLGQMLEQKLMADFQSVDWDRLRVTDPAGGQPSSKSSKCVSRNSIKLVRR